MSSPLPAMKNAHPYLGLAFLTGLNLFNYMDRYVLASVMPPLKIELQLNDTQIGWLTSAFMIGYFATSPVFGYLGDRWQRKGPIAFGVVFWSLGTVLSGFCYRYWTLLGTHPAAGCCSRPGQQNQGDASRTAKLSGRRLRAGHGRARLARS